MLFIYPFIESKERSFPFKDFMCSQLSLAASPSSLVGCIPFCASSMSGQEYSASSKQDKSSVYRGQRERSGDVHCVPYSARLLHCSRAQWAPAQGGKAISYRLVKLLKVGREKRKLSSSARRHYLSPWFLPLWNDSLSGRSHFRQMDIRGENIPNLLKFDESNKGPGQKSILSLVQESRRQ